MNASTTDPNSTVEQSALTRDRVEDLMLERESQFKEKQEEQARLLDELAGKLQSLDLSAAAEMVRLGVWSHFLWVFLGDKTNKPLLLCSSIAVCKPVGVTQCSECWTTLWAGDDQGMGTEYVLPSLPLPPAVPLCSHSSISCIC